MPGSKPLREVLVVYALVAVACFAVTRLRASPVLAPFVPLAIGALFLVTALRLAQRDPGGPRRFGIAMEGFLEPPPEDVRRDTFGFGELFRTIRRALPSALREIGVALAVSAIVFPPFAIGFYYYHAPDRAFELARPDDFAGSLLAQLVIVALPEEAFFRGWMQTRLTDAFPRTVRVLGADVSLAALVLQAALFAIVHLVVEPGEPARLAVFFPGLLFGWLRAQRGGMGAALVLHALSNLFSETLARGWFA